MSGALESISIEGAGLKFRGPVARFGDASAGAGSTRMNPILEEASRSIAVGIAATRVCRGLAGEDRPYADFKAVRSDPGPKALDAQDPGLAI